ncbi:MAG: hypothetical protein P4L79_03705 [Legionella sp.]|uniref:hypothetical protein n=1 Tax=Legionella sp. TaxID=459 RepID=UPI00284496A5|nr:hypothetical protein [Legionella sp.]
MPILAEQVLHKAQSEFQKTASAKHPELKTTKLKADSNGNLKSPFKKLIDDLQLAKYPHPPFTCQQQTIEVDGRTIPVTYIKADGPINLSSEQLHQVSVNSLLLRKVALAATLEAYATQHVTGKNQLKTIRAQIEQLVNESIQEAIKQAENPNQKVNTYDETNEFINKLGTILNNNTQIKNHNEAVRTIKGYERYVLSEMNAGRVIINESTVTTGKGKKNLIQMDIPLDAELTEAQKKEYLRVLGSKKPEWFEKLKPEEQRWYQERVKRATKSADGWTKFAQEVYGTSAMQQALEMKNARKNYFFIDGALQSESTKNATLNPIEVPKKERQQLTIQNAEQLIENQIQGAEERFRAHWGLSADAKLPGRIMIASQSLLSPLLGIADDKMINAQRAAVEHLAKDPRYKDKFQIVFGNDAVNIFRKAQTIDWKYTNEVMDYSRALMTNLQQAGVDSNHPQMKIMTAALAELDALKQAPDLSDRNKAAFKTALTSILIEAAGGKVSTNCKSGKDRTGLEELYHNAILTYYSLYNEFPSYDDGPEKREQFVEIFVHLFNTLKIHESASGNTIGAFGIKDSAKMLCADIAKALGANYTMSNSRANINKTEEALVKKVLKKFDQDKVVVEADVFTDFAVEKLQHRKHELEQKSGKKEKIAVLDQLISDLKKGKELIPALNEFLTNEKNKRVFSSKTGLRQDQTIKLIKKIITEYEDNNKLIEEKKQYQKREHESSKDVKKAPGIDAKQQIPEPTQEMPATQHLRSGAHRAPKSEMAQQSIQTQQAGPGHQNSERLDFEKGQLIQLHTELAKVKKEMEINRHHLAETKEKLRVQRNELALASTALIKEKETANQMDIKLTQEIELLDHLHTALGVQKSELHQLESELEQISSMSDELNSQKTNLEQLVTEHQQESNKLERLTQLQQEKIVLDGLTKEHHKEAAVLTSDEILLKNQQDKKQSLESKKSEMTEELNKIQEESAQKEKNKSFITRIFNAITSFFKSVFGSASNEAENSLATQKTKDIEQLQAEIVQLDNSIEQQGKIVQNQKVKVSGLETHIEEQSRKVQSIQDGVNVNGDINNEIEKQTKKVSKLATEIMHTEQDIEQLKKAEANNHIRIQELTRNISHQREIISNTHVMIDEKEHAIEEQQGDLNSRLSSIQEMEQQLDEKEQSIEKDRLSLHDCEDAIHKNGTEQRHLQTKIIKQEKKIQQEEKQTQVHTSKNDQHTHIERSMSIKQKLQESKMVENDELQINQIQIVVK